MPKPEEVAPLGLTPEMFEGPPTEVWPENRESALIFMALRTQWRHGFNGPTGLDYSVLPETWRRMKVAPDRRDEVFAGLQVLEAAALAAIYED